MLDLTGILFSSIMMLMVIIRAVRLDAIQPWFQQVKLKESATSANQRPWQRQK